MPECGQHRFIYFKVVLIDSMISSEPLTKHIDTVEWLLLNRC